tara:strand:+ start:13208 stop:14854 length:1647 start_codon:yes stop_codon:yes gene_type:complete
MGLFKEVQKQLKKKEEQEKIARLLYGGTQSTAPSSFVAYPGQAPVGYNKGGVVGEHRKMFRKPGLARQALGILASSGELMNEVQPVRMANGGDPLLESINQLKQQMAAEMDMYNQALNFRSPVVAANAKARHSRNIAQLRQQMTELGQRAAERPQARPVGQEIPDAAKLPPQVAAPASSIADFVKNPAAETRRGIAALGQAVTQKASEMPLLPDSVVDTAQTGLASLAEGAKRLGDPALLTEGAELLRQGTEIQPDDTLLQAGAKLGQRGLAKVNEGMAALDRLPGRVGEALASPAGDAMEAMKLRKEAKQAQDKVLKDQEAALQEAMTVKAAEAARAAGLTVGDKAGQAAAEGEREGTSSEADTFESAMSKLADSSLDEKKSGTNDLLVQIGLSIASGQSDDALTNIAQGTLAGLTSFKNRKLAEEKAAPAMIQTIRALDKAGLTKDERKVAMNYLFKTKTRTETGAEVMSSAIYEAAMAGDVVALASLLSQSGSDDPTGEAEDFIKKVEEEMAGTRTAKRKKQEAKEDEGSGFFSKTYDSISGLFD